MKKHRLICLIPSAVLLVCLVFLCISAVQRARYPGGYKRAVSKPKSKPSLSQKELKEDLEYFKFYMQNAYIGYDQMVSQGFDIDSVVEEAFNNTWTNRDVTGRVSAGQLNGQLFKALSAAFNITDKHFGTGGWSPQNDYVIFWSDVYVTKDDEDGCYRILKYGSEKEEGIFPGATYTGSESNLYEWFDGSDKIWRYAVFTKNQIQKAVISINNENLYVPVSSDSTITPTTLWQGMKETENTLYLSFSDFSFGSQGNAGKRQFRSLCENTREHVEGKKNIIIDLRSNPGGEFSRASYLLAKLFFTDYGDGIYEELFNQLLLRTERDSVRLISPPIAYKYRKKAKNSRKENRRLKKLQKEAGDSWEEFEFDKIMSNSYTRFGEVSKKYALSELIFPKKVILPAEYVDAENIKEEILLPDFKGSVYILTNHNSASCSEYTIAFSKEIERMCAPREHIGMKDNDLAFIPQIKFFHIGENTTGAVSYTNPMSFSLPNSGISMYLPTLYTPPFENASYAGEGKGWQPDYWTTSQNLVNTLIQLTGDTALEETLAGLEKRML